MNVTLPGFHAEASLYQTETQYWMGRTAGATGAVVPQLQAVSGGGLGTGTLGIGNSCSAACRCCARNGNRFCCSHCRWCSWP